MRRAVLATVTSLCLLLVAACGQDDSSKPRETSDASQKTDPGTDNGTEVGTDPVGIAATPAGDVWVVLAGDDRLVRVEAGESEPVTEVEVGATPLRVTAAERGTALWVSAFGEGAVVRVDAATGTVTDRVPVGDGAEGVAEAFDSIWVAVQDDGLLVRVDPGTRKVVRKVDVGPGVRLVVPGPDALWLADHLNGVVVRVDATTHRVRRGETICSGPEDLAVAGPVVWVTCSVSEELVAVGASDLQPTKRVPLAGTPDAITTAPDGSLLVVLQKGPTLVRVDSTTGAELGRTSLGDRPQLHDEGNLDIVVTGDDAWITSFSDGRVLRTPWRT
jgi:streptogramin lyase